MKYIVLTTRHHDGFCLWDTKTSEFNAAKMGPKRDLIGEFAEAVRAGGLKLGFYYSFADWHHPDYPGSYERDWPNGWPAEAKRQRFSDYYRAQLEELMSNYGKVDVLWYDGCIPKPPDGAKANARVKQLQPHILINNRNGTPCDFHCSEQAIKPAPVGINWEACLTLNDNWGHHAGDNNWKTPRQVISMLCETASQGGNLLLNVGPRGDGTIPRESQDILKEAGNWLQRNGECLSHSSRSPFTWNNWGRITTRGSTIYLHIFNPTGAELCLAEIQNRVLSARFVDGGTPVRFEQIGPRLFLRNLPVPLPDSIATTIALEVEGEPQALAPQTNFWIAEA
jgi:alpha-L-fucosidase